MTVHSPQITEGRAAFDLAADYAAKSTGGGIQPPVSRQHAAELERLADLKEALQGKIERGRWCLNLLLLDGFDREELDQLRTEVSSFTRACLEWRRK